MTLATTKARVSCDHTRGRAAQGPDSMTGSAQRGKGSGSLVHAAAPISERFSARAARMRSAFECRKRKGLSLRQLQVARVIDGEPVLAGEHHDPGFLW